MTDLFQPLSFKSGAVSKNRFMLAPLTNSQSHADGRLSDDEYHWLTMRAKGGFGLTMTCASHVQANGKGFPGQLGCFSDDHLEGLTRLATGIKAEQSLAVLQLHHAGMRSPRRRDRRATGVSFRQRRNRCACIDPGWKLSNSRKTLSPRPSGSKRPVSMVSKSTVPMAISCASSSARPSISAPISMVVHWKTGRVSFLTSSTAFVQRCSPGFLLGVRLSPERFDLKLGEILEVAQRLMSEGNIDFLDMSLWDSFKEPVEEAFQGKPC